MDVSTLPDEMLTNVLKYTKFGRLMKLRKCNRRIDNLSKRNKMCKRVPVEKLQYKYENRVGGRCDLLMYLDEDDDLDLGITSPILFVVTLYLTQVFQKYLPRIEINYEFEIGFGLDLKENFFAVFHQHKQCFRNLRKLNFDMIEPLISATSATTFYQETMPKVETIIAYRCDKYYNIINTESLSTRNWKRIEFNNPYETEKHLDDTFLTEVVINCQEVEIISASVKFSFPAVVDLFKKCIAHDAEFERKFDLGTIRMENYSIMNVRNSFSAAEFPGVMVTFQEETHPTLSMRIRVCKVCFENHADSPFLKFSFV